MADLALGKLATSHHRRHHHSVPLQHMCRGCATHPGLSQTPSGRHKPTTCLGCRVGVCPVEGNPQVSLPPQPRRVQPQQVDGLGHPPQAHQPLQPRDTQSSVSSHVLLSDDRVSSCSLHLPPRSHVSCASQAGMQEGGAWVPACRTPSPTQARPSARDGASPSPYPSHRNRRQDRRARCA